MKKFTPLLLAVFVIAFVSCEKDPNMDKSDSRYLVYTNYNTKADFRTFETYYLPNSILTIENSKDAGYWKDESAQKILSAYVTNISNRDYVRVDKRETVDLDLQVDYVESTYYFTDYGRPGRRWNYPGCWDAPYQGNWGGWYYPYTINYTCNIGPFITESLDLNAPQGEEEKLPVLWTSYMNGLLSGSTSFNTKMTVKGVNRAFTQSAYLSRMSTRPR